MKPYQRSNSKNKTFWIGGKNDQGVVIPRSSLGCRDEATALACAAAVNELRSWSKQAFDDAVQKAKLAPAPTVAAMSLVEAKKHFLETFTRKSTKRAYSSAVQRLIDHTGLHLCSEVTSLHCQKLQTSWVNETKVRGKVKSLKLNSIKTFQKHNVTFMNFCFKHDWIGANPWKKLNPVKPEMLSGNEHKAVHEDDDDERVGIATLPIDRYGHDNWLLIQSSTIAFLKNRPTDWQAPDSLVTHPENFLALLEVMYETGLRRSDAVRFRPDKIKRSENGGWEYTTTQYKTRPHKVRVYPPDWLVEKLRKLPRLDREQKFVFYDGHRELDSWMNSQLNEPLARLGDSIGIPELHPHRFRDSFAVNCFNLGMTLEQVQILLGHQSKSTTERHYSPYVKSRGVTVEAQLIAARQGLLLAPVPGVQPTVQ